MISVAAFFIASLSQQDLTTNPLKQLRYQSGVEIRGDYKGDLSDCVVGWHLPKADRSQLAKWLGKVTDADVSFTDEGKISLYRSKQQTEAFEATELQILTEQLHSLAREHRRLQGSFTSGTSSERLEKYLQDLADSKPGHHFTNYEFLINTTPASELLANALPFFEAKDLKGLVRGRKLRFWNSVSLGDSPLPFDISILVAGYETGQQAFYDAVQASAVIDQHQDIFLDAVLPWNKPTVGQPVVEIELNREGGEVGADVSVFDAEGKLQSVSGIVSRPDFKTRIAPGETADPASRPKISARSLRHFNQSKEKLVSPMWKLVRAKDPAQVIIDPSLKDPLSFEVEEALDDLAKWKGATGWVANCPDQAFEALEHSIVDDSVDLATFEKRLTIEGNCKVSEEDGVLLVSPIRPLLASAYRLPRTALKRMATTYARSKTLTYGDIADYSLSAQPFVTGLRELFDGLLYWDNGLFQPGLSFLPSYSYALLGCIAEPYRTGVLNGSAKDVPGSVIDFDQSAALGLVSAAGQLRDRIFQTESEGLYRPAAGVEPTLRCWSDPAQPVVRFLRKVAIDEPRRINGKPTVIHHLAGEDLCFWSSPAQADDLSDFAYAPAQRLTEASLRSGLFLYGTKYTIHFQFLMPNGVLSEAQTINRVVRQTPYAVDFTKLPDAMQAELLENLPKNHDTGHGQVKVIYEHGG